MVNALNFKIAVYIPYSREINLLGFTKQRTTLTSILGIESHLPHVRLDILPTPEYTEYIQTLQFDNQFNLQKNYQIPMSIDTIAPSGTKENPINTEEKVEVAEGKKSESEDKKEEIFKGK